MDFFFLLFFAFGSLEMSFPVGVSNATQRLTESFKHRGVKLSWCSLAI